MCWSTAIAPSDTVNYTLVYLHTGSTVRLTRQAQNHQFLIQKIMRSSTLISRFLNKADDLLPWPTWTIKIHAEICLIESSTLTNQKMRQKCCSVHCILMTLPSVRKVERWTSIDPLSYSCFLCIYCMYCVTPNACSKLHPRFAECCICATLIILFVRKEIKLSTDWKFLIDFKSIFLVCVCTDSCECTFVCVPTCVFFEWILESGIFLSLHWKHWLMSSPARP